MSEISNWLLDPERENDESICYDDDLPIYEAAMGAAREARALEATIADLRDRLRVMAGEAGGACDDCGCAARYYNKRCFDCHYVNWRACYESGEPEPWEGRCLVCGCSTDEPQAVRAALKGSP